VWPFAAASAGACALGLLLALLVPGPARIAALWGAAAAAVSGALALSALALLAGKGLNGVLAGFTAGFLARAALVAAGLFASGARGDLALVYAAAFFALYAATQIIEVLFVRKSSPGAPT
jgi:hypothetical protein